jgi:uncharacterized Zn finger protein
MIGEGRVGTVYPSCPDCGSDDVFQRAVWDETQKMRKILGLCGPCGRRWEWLP